MAPLDSLTNMSFTNSRAVLRRSVVEKSSAPPRSLLSCVFSISPTK